MPLSAMELQIRELKDAVLKLNETNVELKGMLKASQERETLLQEKVDYLTKKLFGSSSEKSNKLIPGQLSLFDEAEMEADPSEPAPEIERELKAQTRKRKTTYTEKLKGIPVEEIVYDVPENRRICARCGSKLMYIGREIVRVELQYKPAKVKVLRYVQLHYGCPECKKEGITNIVKSDVPLGLMNHSLASPSSVAWVMYQKYANSIPLYRQEKDWEQYGVKLSRTTLANWVIECSNRYFSPLFDYLHRKLIEREHLMADETRVQVLKEPGRTAETDSYMWLFRTGEDGLPPIILYSYSPTRSGNTAASFLADYKGYLECDGYAGYNNLPNIKRCACYAHIRRYFVDAIPSGKDSDLSNPAVQGVQYCNSLFRYEKEANEKGLSFEARGELRLKKEKPVIDAFVKWLKQQNPTSGNRFDKAVKYALNQERYMYTYLEDGRCSLSNNLSENAIRPFTVGRKNWLFSDSVDGAKASAVVYSMVEMAKANSLNIYCYLEYLLTNRPGEKPTDDELEALCPWNKAVQEACRNSK